MSALYPSSVFSSGFKAWQPAYSCYLRYLRKYDAQRVSETEATLGQIMLLFGEYSEFNCTVSISTLTHIIGTNNFPF